jgi:hypothetical protein
MCWIHPQGSLAQIYPYLLHTGPCTDSQEPYLDTLRIQVDPIPMYEGNLTCLRRLVAGSCVSGSGDSQENLCQRTQASIMSAWRYEHKRNTNELSILKSPITNLIKPLITNNDPILQTQRSLLKEARVLVQQFNEC